MPSPPPAPGWSEARVHELKAMLAQDLSASQIAKALGGGVTRNAVIGKIHRLGLAGGRPPSPPGRARPTTPVRTRRRVTSKPPSPPPPRPRPPGGGAGARIACPAPVLDVVAAFDLSALPRRACRWPIGDPRHAGFGFCAAPAQRPPYCEGHRARAYRPPQVIEDEGSRPRRTCRGGG